MEIKELVDHALIEAAVAKHKKAAARAGETEAALSAATDAHARAKRASEAAIAGNGDAAKAEIALEAAQRAVTVATKVRDAAQRAREEALAGIDAARGKAHQPVFAAGVAARLAACRKADKARALLAEAVAEFHAGTAMLNFAASNGTPRIGDPGIENRSSPSLTPRDGTWMQPTEAEELATWRTPRGWWSLDLVLEREGA